MRGKISKLLIAFAVVYAAAGNYVLNSDFFRRQLASWDDGDIQFERAITPLPGLLFVKGFSLTHQDKHVLWNVKIASTQTLFNPLALLWKKISIWGLATDDARFRFVVREHQRTARAEAKEALPPLKFPKPEKPKQFPETPGGWGVEIRNIYISGLKEAWVNEYRYDGNIRVSGGFQIIPDQAVEVGPAKVAFDRGDVYIGNERLAHQLDGTIHYVMERFNPDGADEDVFRSMSLEVSLKSQASSLAPLNFFWRSAPWIRLDKGQGALEIALKMNNGVLVAPGKVSFETPSLALLLGENRVNGKAKVSWILEKDSPDSKGTVRLEDVVMTRSPRHFTILKGGSVEIGATTRKLSLVEEGLFKTLALSLHIEGGKIPELQNLNAFVPARVPFRFVKGSARFGANIDSLTEKPGDDKGLVFLESEDAVFEVNGRPMAGKIASRVPVRRGSLNDLKFAFDDVETKFSDVTVNGGSPTQWKMEVAVREGAFQAKPLMGKGRVEVRMDNSAPFLAMLDAGNSGIVQRLFTVDDIRVNGNVHLNDDEFAVRQLTFRSHSLQADGDLKTTPAGKNGKFLFVLEPLALGLEIKGEDRRFILNDAFGWWHRAQAE